MSIDTRDKRFSMMGLAQPSPSVMANPDGTIGAADRAQLVFLYSGIALSVIEQAVGIVCAALSSRQPGIAFTDRQPAIALEATSCSC